MAKTTREKIISWLLAGIFLVFPLGQLGALPFGWMGIRVYCQDVILAVLWGVLLLESKEWIQIIKTESVAKALGIWGLFALFSWLVNLPFWGKASFLGIFYWLRWVGYTGMYFGLKILQNKQYWSVGETKRWLIFAGISTAILGLGQYLMLPDLRFLRFFGWDDHYYRLIGSQLDPNFTGAILLPVIFLSWRSLEGGQKWLVLGVLHLALALTFSRSSYLGYLAGVAIYSLIRKRARMLISVCLIGGVLLWMLPRPFGEGVNLSRQATVWARVKSWQRAFFIVRKHPLFGVGFNNYRVAQKYYQFLGPDWQKTHAGGGVDNSLLFVMATTGLIGWGSYAWLWIHLLLTDVVSFLPLIVHGLFNNTLFYPWVMIQIWVLAAKVL